MRFPFCSREARPPSLDGVKAGTLKMANQSPNGASYIHFISTGSKPDSGVLLDTVSARVK